MKIKTTFETIKLDEDDNEMAMEQGLDDWRSEVLKDHQETSRMVNDALLEVKETSEDTQDLLSSTISVSDIWNSYQDKFKMACRRLGERIEADEREREEMMAKYGKVFKKGHHHKLSTTLANIRQQKKFVCRERKDMSF